MRVQAEGQEKALRKQKNQGQRASQENAAHHLIENPRLLQRKQTVHLHFAKQISWFDTLCFTRKRGSVGQSEGLLIIKLSIRFIKKIVDSILKPRTQIHMNLSYSNLQSREIKLLLKVIKAIIILKFASTMLTYSIDFKNTRVPLVWILLTHHKKNTNNDIMRN